MALFETTDSFGRLIQELGTPGAGAVSFTNSKDAADTVQLIRNPDGSQSVIELWRVFNTTADTHPIHLHQVSFQVVSRQAFTATDVHGVPYATIDDPTTPGYTANTAGAFTYTLIGQPTGPYANEIGAWKDTVQMNPGQVTTIIAKFDLPGTYVWHCHILEHEEHDMMHWLVIEPAPTETVPVSPPSPPAPSPTPNPPPTFLQAAVALFLDGTRLIFNLRLLRLNALAAVHADIASNTPYAQPWSPYFVIAGEVAAANALSQTP
jgi:hypothetical protein